MANTRQKHSPVKGLVNKYRAVGGGGRVGRSKWGVVH